MTQVNVRRMSLKLGLFNRNIKMSISTVTYTKNFRKMKIYFQNPLPFDVF